MKKIGLYIHIPFRIYKHNHRAVLSYFNKDFYIRDYFKYLRKELDLRIKDDYLIDSIYLGGGDPSSVNTDYITDLLDYIYEKYNVRPECEKTIEVDSQIPEIRIQRYVEHGINRFSIKAFTFLQKGLDNLDLLHSKEDIIHIIKVIRKFKVQNINLDMFFAYPEETFKDIETDIFYINKLQLPHVSFYSAKSEEDIILTEDNMESRIEVPGISVEESAEFISKKLLSIGYEHYELNHYCKRGYQSYHNKKYWNLDEYLGIGMGASGYIDNVLYTNSFEFEDYFRKLRLNELAYQEKDLLTDEEKSIYYIINKMTMNEGLDLKEFKNRFSIDFEEKYKDIIKKYLDENLIKISGDIIKFTDEGLYYSNEFYTNII